MRKLITQYVLVPLAAALALLAVGLDPSFAHQDINYWRVPGHHKLADTPEGGRSEMAVNCAVTALQMSPDVARQFRAKVAAHDSTVIILKDGDRFSRMTFEGCRVEGNVVVWWGANAPYDRRAERVVIVKSDGTKLVYDRPYICNNWSLVEVIPPPVARCFIVHFDYQSNAHVMAEGNLQTAGALVASGAWHGSEDQGYLNDDVQFAFVLMHLDFADEAELARFQNDDCTGVRDSTGFHHVVEYGCDICMRGRWPSPQMLDELYALRGIRLPAAKPNGAFRFPCAEGKCEFSMPLWAARAFLPCVEVPRYHVTLPGFYRDRDADNFDVVTAEDIGRSLARGKRVKGDVVLTDARGSIRYLAGDGSYTVPGSY